VFHTFQRYTWIPRVCILFILIGTAATYFNTATPSFGHTKTVAGDRISFFLVELIGTGLGSGLASQETWGAAYKAHGLGALIVADFKPLGGFEKFCSVILALGILANNIPGTYFASLSFQLLYSPILSKIPRPFFISLTVIIYTVIAAVGYKHLQAICGFLSIIGYWTIIWVIITLEELLIFRRDRGWEWESWNNAKVLPAGWAALVIFCVGLAGAVLGMDQVHFIGPIGKLVGDYGADLGIPIAPGWTMVVYPPLRWLELKFVRR
jgi:purine-cytosine permease-like protein